LFVCLFVCLFFVFAFLIFTCFGLFWTWFILIEHVALRIILWNHVGTGFVYHWWLAINWEIEDWNNTTIILSVIRMVGSLYSYNADHPIISESKCSHMWKTHAWPHRLSISFGPLT
jgi:hypothetical protein